MARKRMIDPSFWTDEKLGECSVQERLLFMGLISNADDEGYGRANPKLLKSLIFPYDDLRASDLEKWLSHLGGLHIVVLYEYNGQTYYNLPNFLKHQTINRPTETSFPKLDSEGVTVLTEYSMSAHGVLTPKRKEENRKEKKGREEKESIASRFEEIYSRECSNLPQLKVLSEQRKKAIQKFSDVFSIEQFEEICKIANKSDFLIGKNARGWKADFDFILRTDKATSILEGKYSNEVTSESDITPSSTEDKWEKLKRTLEQRGEM